MKFTAKLLMAATLFSAACGPTTSTKQKDMKKVVGIEISNMDKHEVPGNNFYEYANGGWLQKNPIPAEYSRYGNFAILGKKNQKEIKSIIEDAAKKSDLAIGSPEQQIRDFYKSGMDTVLIEKLGMDPILPMLEQVNDIDNKADLVDMQAYLNMNGAFPLFGVFSSQDDKNSTQVIANLSQGGLGLPDRDYYTKDDERTKKIRAAYLQYIQNMFVLTGDTKEIAANKAKSIMNIETSLAKASMTMLERRDPNATYNIKSLKEIAKEVPEYDFTRYFNDLKIKQVERINVRQPKFFIGMGKMFKTTNLKDLKTYFAWNIINENAGKLSKKFVNETFHFYSTTLSGVSKMRPRWKRIISSTNSNLGNPVGKLYVAKYFPAESKKRMIALVSNLRLALKESIENLDWMCAETKAKAEEKLAAINLKVGYPNIWIDYSSVVIEPNSYVQNTWNCAAFSYRRDLDKIGKPVDREEWGMNPQTVNAYYNPNMNEIVFPAAILQPPFFDPEADDAVNYGAIGVVIGHEMTHGFDDQGRLYDKEGNLHNWWTKEDAKKFKEKTQLLVKEYSNYVVLDSLHINGELTLGENIADNGGLFISYAALQKSYEQNGPAKAIDGLNSDQRFLISYAQVWRQHIRPKALMRNLQEDVHSPGIARVNVGVANLPWWYSAFNVTPKDSLYIAPKDRAKIW